MLLRTKLTFAITCLALMRGEPRCSCLDDGPCVYDEIELAPDAETPWATTPADDIAALEVPQPGTWRWGESKDFIDVEHSGVELPATAIFEHDPTTIRYSEHVAGGTGVSCDGPTVSVEGTLTFWDEQDEIIVSVHVTVERQYTAEEVYVSSPQYSPISEFSPLVEELDEHDFTQVFGSLLWLPQGLVAEFYYHGQTMTTETSGDGVFSLVGSFEPDAPP